MIPEALGIGRDPLVHHPRAVHRRRQPPGRHDDARPARELVEVLALDGLRRERRAIHDAAARIGRLERIDLLRAVHELHGERVLRDAELVHPAARHHVELVFLREVGVVLRHLHPDRARVLRLQLRDDLLGHPEVALLVGRQHADVRARRARRRELRARLVGDLPALLGRLAQPRLEIDLRSALHLRQDAAPQLRPEVVHLPWHLHRVVEDRHRIGDADARHRRRRLRAGALQPADDVLLECRIRPLDEELHVERVERSILQVGCEHVELRVDLARLPGGGARLEESIHLERRVRERRRSPRVVPDVRHAPREIRGGRFGPRGIRARDDGGRGVAERLRHHLYDAFAGVQVVEVRLADLRARSIGRRESGSARARACGPCPRRASAAA